MFVLRPLLFPSSGVRRLGLNCECRIGQGDFIDWIFALLPNLMEESGARG